MTVAEKHLVECWSALKLGFEVLSAKLVGGNAVDAVDLIKLNEALAQYMPPRKQYETNKLQVCFVGSRTAGLSGEAFDRFEALADRLDKVDTETDPQSLADALLTIEALRRQVDEQRGKLAHLQERVAAATAPVGVMEILPPPEPALSVPDRDILPPPPKQLPSPAPSRADEQKAMGWTAALGQQPRNPATAWTAAGGYYDVEGNR
jgi:hypothetical protein